MRLCTGLFFAVTLSTTHLLTNTLPPGVQTEPGKVRCLDGNDVWIVPLYSWYAGPDDDPKNTLYIPGGLTSWKDLTLKEMGWSDAYFCKVSSFGSFNQNLQYQEIA